MKKIPDLTKRSLDCEIINALSKTPDVYDQLCASYGVSHTVDLSDDDLRKEYIRIVKTKEFNKHQYSYSSVDVAYLDLLKELVDIAENETARSDRTNTGTFGKFGHQMRFDLSVQFPILSTKRVYMQGIKAELLWFLRGDTNIQYLLKNKCSIWTDWRYKQYLNKVKEHNSKLPEIEALSIKEFENMIINHDTFAKVYGDIGKGYGYQWRNFGEIVLDDCDTDLSESMNHEAESGNGVVKTGFDQVEWVINEIKTNPTSRRLIVSGWNPHDVNQVDLPPCHTLFQFFVKDGKLSCQLYQRSADVFLGVPFNIASYALLTHMIAQVCDLEVGDFVWTGGDVHLYANHIEQAKEQLARSTVQTTLPQIFIPNKPIDQLTVEDIELFGYNPQPAIKAPVAV